ncbi:MAG: anion permease, partial [Gemmatimonadetes bacterium]|nr:anion permease [Gemmatimonadota bacterium]
MLSAERGAVQTAGASGPDAGAPGARARPGSGGEGTGGGGSARRRRLSLALGAALFLIVLAAPLPAAVSAGAQRAAAVALLMAAWWMTEALPVAATALLPLALFPLLGVLTPTAAAAPYANPVIFLFMGGFLLALAMQRWGLHLRVALLV